MGDTFTITPENVDGTAEICSTTFLGLPGDVNVGDTLLIDEDEDNLRWALRTGVDIVALSFVRGPEDVTRVHEIMDGEGRRIPVIAKIENPRR